MEFVYVVYSSIGSIEGIYSCERNARKAAENIVASAIAKVHLNAEYFPLYSFDEYQPVYL